MAREVEAVFRDEIPLLARDLACLAADTDGRVGEEADALLLLLAVGGDAVGERAHVFRTSAGSTRGSCSRRDCACSRNSATNSGSAAPRGRRPGWIPHV